MTCRFASAQPVATVSYAITLLFFDTPLASTAQKRNDGWFAGRFIVLTSAYTRCTFRQYVCQSVWCVSRRQETPFTPLSLSSFRSLLVNNSLHIIYILSLIHI